MLNSSLHPCVDVAILYNRLPLIPTPFPPSVKFSLSQGALSSYQASVFSELDSIASASPTAASSIKSFEADFQSQLSALSFEAQTSANPEIFSSGVARLSSSIANANKTTDSSQPNETGEGSGSSSLLKGAKGLIFGLVFLVSIFSLV